MVTANSCIVAIYEASKFLEQKIVLLILSKLSHFMQDFLLQKAIATIQLSLLVYQKTIYNAANIPITINAPIINQVDTLNMELSVSNALGLFFDLGSSNPNKMISATQAKNTIPIRFKNGMEGSVYLSNADKGMLVSVAASAPLELDRFQKNPIRNMARIPGEIKPVNS